MNRQQQKAHTRQTLKTIAKQAFSENGIDATNTREISAKAGVAVGTFFSHFPDKMVLVKEIFFDQMDEQLTSELNSLFAESHMHPCEFINDAAEILFSFYLQHRNYTLAVLEKSLLDNGFLQTQLQQLEDNTSQRFQRIQVDVISADIFAKNMVSNFQYVLLDMLASKSLQPDAWLTSLSELNLPFNHIYQNALKRFESQNDQP